VDLCTKSLYFDVPQKVASNGEKLTSKNIISEGENYHLDESCTKFSNVINVSGVSKMSRVQKLCSLE